MYGGQLQISRFDFLDIGSNRAKSKKRLSRFMERVLIAPSPLSGPDLEKAIAKIARRVIHRNETVLPILRVFMPYHRLRIRCADTDRSTLQIAETALNAVFCGIAAGRELLQLFRPKHLEKPLQIADPQANEIVCSYPEVDVDQIASGLLGWRAQTEIQLAETEQRLSKEHRNMQWRYLLLPTSTRSLEREKRMSSKFAELQSTLLSIDICLNLNPGLIPQSVETRDIVYVPMSIVQLKQKDELIRYSLIDLATMKEDPALTKFCEAFAFRSELERAMQRST